MVKTDGGTPKHTKQNALTLGSTVDDRRCLCPDNVNCAVMSFSLLSVCLSTTSALGHRTVVVATEWRSSNWARALYQGDDSDIRTSESILTLLWALVIIVPHRIIWSWYTGRWWVGSYIWYNEEETGPWGRSPPRPLLAVPNVTAHPSAASVIPIIALMYNGPLNCGFKF